MINSVKGVLESRYGDQVRMIAWYAEIATKDMLVHIPFQRQCDYDGFTNFFKILDKFICVSDVVYERSSIDCDRFSGRSVALTCLRKVVRLLNQKYNENHAEYNTPIVTGELNLIKTIAESINTVYSPDSDTAEIKYAFYNIANAIAGTAMHWTGGFNWEFDEVIEDAIYKKDNEDEDEEAHDDVVEKIFSTDYNRQLFAKYACEFEYNFNEEDE